MADESHWIERAQNAEAALQTCRDQIDRVKEQSRETMNMLGAKKRSDGSIDIDFIKLAQNISIEHAFDLRNALDEQHGFSGAPGEKVKVRVKA